VSVEILLALVCDDARPDPEAKLDIHGVFNDLFARSFPARQDRMVLVLVLEWEREDQGRFKFRVDLLDPGGRKTLTVDGHTDVDARPDPNHPPARTRLLMPLENVVFPLPGPYRFRVRVKGTELDGPSLHLVQIPDDEDATAVGDGGGTDPSEPEGAPGG